MKKDKRKNLIIGIATTVIGAAVATPFLAPPIDIAMAFLEKGKLPKSLPPDDPTSYVGWAIARDGKLATAGDWAPFALAFAAICLIVMALFAYEKSKNPSREVANGIMGDARLIESARELRRKNDSWDGKGAPKRAGLVLGSSEKGYLFDGSVPHSAIVGKTGSGKTWLMVLQTLHLLMAAGWSLLVTGKAELLELTGDKAEALGYRVVVLDLAGYPGASRYNPLDLVVGYLEAGQLAEAQRAARQLCANLVPIEDPRQAYFYNGARDLLLACALVVALADIPREEKNMASVKELFSRGTSGEGADASAPLKDYIRGLGPDHPAYAAASDFLSDGGKTNAGKNVLSTLKTALSIFDDEGIREATATSDVGIRELVREKSVVYLQLLEENDPYLKVFSCFIDQWYRVAQEEAAANAGRLPYETAIVGDEFGNLPKISSLGEMVTLGRSMRLHVYAWTQDLKQWHKYDRPGDDHAGRDKILGSMGCKVALSLANPDDFDFFTRLAGKRTVRSHGTSSQKNPSGAGSGESYSERAEDLIHPWEWQNRVAIRDGVIAIKGGENSRPGREGVFRFPVGYASNTPAGAFFGLGDEVECALKRARFRAAMENRAAERDKNGTVPIWCPDFGEDVPDDKDGKDTGIAGDEKSAWDEWDPEM